MNIWLLQTGEPLPLSDTVRRMRTGLLADRLVRRGHTVRWWTSAFEHQRKMMLFDREGDVPLSANLTLQVLRGCGYKGNVSLQRYWDHLLISKKFGTIARKFPPPDIIISSMPDHHLSYEAVVYAKENKIPIIIDIRDLWPDIFLSHLKQPFVRRAVRIALSLDFSHLRYLLKNADSLVAVSKGYLNWAVQRASRSICERDRCFYLGYQNHAGTKNSSGKDAPSWMRGLENKKLFIFIGTFGVSYELPLLLQAAWRMESAGRKDICFVIAGTGEQHEAVQKAAQRLSNVVLPGWIGGDDIKMLLEKGYAGVVPCRSIENTVPNKPFEYLSSGLPLISSLEGEMADVIKEYHIGFNYHPGDVEGLCAAIDKLSYDEDLWRKISANASDFFHKYGDAEKIYTDYSEHIEHIASLKN